MKECKIKGTYISVSGDLCCAHCFSSRCESVKIEVVEVVKDTKSIKEIDDNYVVIKNGKEIKSFNKYADDYAYTNARNFMNALT